MTKTADMGVVGLGVMGKSLALNIEEKGHAVALFDIDVEKGRAIAAEAPAARLVPVDSLEELVAVLRPPRRILVMVPAGRPVEASLAGLAPLLEQGDVVIDGGNEHWRETERRQRSWAERGLHLVGMGVSGGQEGARRGPSLMPSGARAAYDALEPVLTRMAAQVSDGPCVTYVGPGGAGHFVKMVHNGIEYADMQLIAEVYDLLRHVGGLDDAALAELFDDWNRGELESFLVEITAEVLRRPDDRGGRGLLVNAILDTAKMKGTGSWTVIDGAELAAPIPTIAAAVEARLMSGQWDLRQKAAELLPGPRPGPALTPGDARERVVADARAALYAAKLCAYAQGMQLLRVASEERGWGIALDEVARIWKAGCIIRARLLVDVQAAFRRDPGAGSLLLDPAIAASLVERQSGWRRTVALCVEHGITAPALTSALAYYDGVRRSRLPANLTQAQRDYFGAHGYQRVDEPGSFHADWRSTRRA